jgi:hypothetical protein
MINKRLLSLAVVGIMLLGMTGLALANVPDPTLSTATTAGGSVLITPAGTGVSLADAGCTVNVVVKDGNGDFISGYPFQDIWLDDAGSNDIALCQGGSTADANTNSVGETTIGGLIAGGGWTTSGMQVYLAGVALTGPNLAINVVSPDITGNLIVDLADVGPFAADVQAGSGFRSDFNFDTFVNLGDVGTFVRHLGDRCQ